MTYLVKAATIYYDEISTFQSIRYPFDPPIEVELGLNRERDLFPNIPFSNDHILEPTRKESGELDIPYRLEHHELCFVLLRPGFTLRGLTTMPDGLIVDVGYTGDSVMWLFFNGSEAKQFRIQATETEDKKDVLARIRSDPRNHRLRERIIEQARLPIPRYLWIGNHKEFAQYVNTIHANEEKKLGDPKKRPLVQPIDTARRIFLLFQFNEPWTFTSFLSSFNQYADARGWPNLEKYIDDFETRFVKTLD
jgi:hypothetical protein